MSYKSFKFLLRPNEEQEQTLVKWMGSTRWIWNYYLNLNKEKYNETKKFLFKHEMITQIPNLKKQNEWLKELPSQALQQRCIDLDMAIQRVWKQGNGFPKFKSKNIEHHNTLRITQTNGQINPRKKQIKIPKMGWVNWKRYRPLEGKLKSITIKKENNLWWCICLCELPDSSVCYNATHDEVVGIDLGLKEFAITSDGEIFDTPKIYRKKQKRLRRQQRQMAKKKKGSKNREKARKKLNKTHYKIKCQRNDFTHKASSQITNDYLFIAVEDLNIRGMMKNRKLSKSIADQGWSMFVNQLIYKSKLNGGCTVKIDRFAPSSKTCSSCGNIQDMPLNIRTYECPRCGVETNRDINAAINIKNWGIDEINRCGTHRIYACGDTNDGGQLYDWSNYVSVKQEKFFSFGEEAAI
ncbi:MAG: RNA-guided endonuclease InsQ/TnpB family protein [bacterium]